MSERSWTKDALAEMERPAEWFEEMEWLCKKVYRDGPGSIPPRWLVQLYRYIGFNNNQL